MCYSAPSTSASLRAKGRVCLAKRTWHLRTVGVLAKGSIAGLIFVVWVVNRIEHGRIYCEMLTSLDKICQVNVGLAKA